MSAGTLNCAPWRPPRETHPKCRTFRIFRANQLRAALVLLSAGGHRARVVIGGDWEVVEDATHDQHTISPYALSVILHDLGVHRDGS